MAKQYVYLNDAVDAELRLLQGALIRDFKTEVSYTTVVNMVLIGGLLAADKLGPGDWAMIRKYWQERTEDIPVSGRGDLAAAHVRQAA